MSVCLQVVSQEHLSVTLTHPQLCLTYMSASFQSGARLRYCSTQLSTVYTLRFIRKNRMSVFILCQGLPARSGSFDIAPNGQIVLPGSEKRCMFTQLALTYVFWQYCFTSAFMGSSVAQNLGESGTICVGVRRLCLSLTSNRKERNIMSLNVDQRRDKRRHYVALAPWAESKVALSYCVHTK